MVATSLSTHQLQLATIFEEMADAVYLIDPYSSNIQWCNRSAYRDLGYSKDEVLNHSVLSLQTQVEGAPQWSEIAQVIRQQANFTFVGHHLHKDGYEIPVEVNTTHFELDEREYFLSVARNISNRVSFEKDFKHRDDRIRYAMHEVLDGLWEWEVATDHVFFSPQLKKMLGYGPDEMRPHLDTWKQNVHPDDAPKVVEILTAHLKGKRPDFKAEYRLRNRNGHYIWVHDAGKVCHRDEQNNPSYVIGMVRNISDHKKMQSQLEEIANEDLLTGLPNRRHGERLAQKILQTAKAQQQPFSVAVLDLDYFKQVNDTYGHQKGDEVLSYVAQVLNKAVLEGDCLYRWGGEEFVLVMANASEQEVERKLQSCHQLLSDADWQVVGIQPLTISIGFITSHWPYARDFEELFRLADLATYQAKANGRSQTIRSQL